MLQAFLAGHPKSYFSPYNLQNISDGPEGEYLTDRITDEAIAWISSVKDKPFFAYIPYYTVHTPLQAIRSLKQKYLQKKAYETSSKRRMRPW